MRMLPLPATLTIAGALAIAPLATASQQSSNPVAGDVERTETRITEYMAARARVTGFSGAVLVARHGQPFSAAHSATRITNSACRIRRRPSS